MPRTAVALIAAAWIGGTALVEARAQHGRPPAEVVWPLRVEGYGLDPAAAKEHAYQTACREIEIYLHQRPSPIRAWRPTATYIRAQLLEREEAGSDLPLDAVLAKRWVLFLKPPDLETVHRLDESKQRQARDEQRRERNHVFARMIAGVLLLVFIVGAGCKVTVRLPCRRKAIAC